MLRHLYSLSLYVLLPLLLLYFWWRSRKDPAYRQRLAERFGFGLARQLQRSGGIVVHAVSVGEVIAAIPMIHQLQQQYPDKPITVTCTTPTGSATIQSRLGSGVQHCYLPLDYPGAVRRFLKALQPELLVILETELWPNLLQSCARRAIPVVVVNARLSARSARGYRRFAAFTRPLLQHIKLLLAQDRASARRFRALGYQGDLQVTGNLKFELAVPATTGDLLARFKPAFAGRIVWVAASTHAGEDEQLLAMYPRLKQQFPELLLLLVPRHPERFEQVAGLVAQAGLSLWRRSSIALSDTSTPVPVLKSDIVLGDSMGELLAWYQLADLVFIGGSLIKRGGHNPLEAICFGKAVQSGPWFFNFNDVYRQLQQQQAVTLVADSNELAESTRRLLTDTAGRQAQGKRGHTFFLQQQGAMSRTVRAIDTLVMGTMMQSSMQQEQDYQVKQQGNAIYWFEPAFFQDISAEHFQSHWWQQQQAVIGSSAGRNTAYFVRHQQHNLVLRHYYRGGLVGKVLHDQFLMQPVQTSRAMQEYQLLSWMRQQGLAVPRPVAASYQRSGLIYRADLLIELIPDSKDLAAILQQRALSGSEWQAVGAAIAQMHQLGVYHSDLNCRNILLDGTGKVWLIDFDKCERRSMAAWTTQNLDRLLRSFNKEKGKLNPFFWQESDWQQLQTGYQQQLQEQSSAA
ncbi:lipid IV(A) 3-deoxy-D-manno-octulosonic acid transferase [Alkalimonas sp. NCh-2]|uniref:lipid IV(A) 3-deoxy-D-manno-octulosonic acid transferase n=1 Tax=Alkalimonas sp. NCh-2 TaxID=3144846 RepID=UPI0031F6B97F